MYRLVVILALVASAYGYGRIVGGKDANIEQFNHQVSLRLYGSHRCGGSILTSTVVVTAAHCVSGYTNSPTLFTVKGGSSSISIGGQVKTVQKIHQDQRYNPSIIDYDVAVLIVDEFEFNEKVGTVALAPRDFKIDIGTLSSVTGWGRTVEGGHLPSTLQVVEVPFVDWQECKHKYNRFTVTERMSCWGYTKGGKDACQGDSGGPLIIYDDNKVPQLAGIVSWGVGCARPNYPGVYTDVTNVDIHDHITQFL